MAAPTPTPTLSPTLGSPQTFDWDTLVSKKIIEISGEGATARLSCAVDLVLRAQCRGETVAWIQPQKGRLYPPDLQHNGVDLAALVVIQVPPQAGSFGIPKAAEMLLRSGAYGLVVLDLLDGVPANGMAWQGRLLALTRAHRSAALLLTQKAAHTDSVGPLASLRLEPRRRHRPDPCGTLVQLHPGRGLAVAQASHLAPDLLGGRQFWLEPLVLKNKAGLAWPQALLPRCGPAGL